MPLNGEYYQGTSSRQRIHSPRASSLGFVGLRFAGMEITYPYVLRATEVRSIMAAWELASLYKELSDEKNLPNLSSCAPRLCLYVRSVASASRMPGNQWLCLHKCWMEQQSGIIFARHPSRSPEARSHASAGGVELLIPLLGCRNANVTGDYLLYGRPGFSQSRFVQSETLFQQLVDCHTAS
jgi:hypothetical protein